MAHAQAAQRQLHYGDPEIPEAVEEDAVPGRGDDHLELVTGEVPHQVEDVLGPAAGTGRDEHVEHAHRLLFPRRSSLPRGVAAGAETRPVDGREGSPAHDVLDGAAPVVRRAARAPRRIRPGSARARTGRIVKTRHHQG